MNDFPRKRKGLLRLFYACVYSFAGLKSALREAAFRQEIGLYAVLLIVLFFLDIPGETRWKLLMVNTLVLIVEILNSAIEAIVDLVSPGYHDLAKRAKDLGSAAVFMSLLLAAGTWLWVLI
jgi:diacylglycerol kinase (ATP)